MLAVPAVPDPDALSGAGDTYSVLEAEIGKNTEGVDGSSYPTAPRCTCRSATDAGGALMISDKELPWAGQLPGPFASKHQHHHVAAKPSVRRIRRSPPTSYAGHWSQTGLHAQAHALD